MISLPINTVFTPYIYLYIGSGQPYSGPMTGHLSLGTYIGFPKHFARTVDQTICLFFHLSCSLTCERARSVTRLTRLTDLMTARHACKDKLSVSFCIDLCCCTLQTDVSLMHGVVNDCTQVVHLLTSGPWLLETTAESSFCGAKWHAALSRFLFPW